MIIFFMGCACLSNIEIKTKYVDISEEQTKVHYNGQINNSNIFTSKISDDIFKVKNCNLKNTEKPIKKLINKNSESIHSNKTKSYDLSGTIITLLKNRVDNYQRKNKNQ